MLGLQVGSATSGSTQEAGAGKDLYDRSACCAQQISGQPGLQSEVLNERRGRERGRGHLSLGGEF